MRAFVFDLDGTLLNTLADIGAACNMALRRRGFPEHSVASYRKMVGNGFPTLIKRALPPDSGEDLIKELIADAWRLYVENMTVFTEPYPGMPRALYELACDGCALAVLSNKPDEMTQMLVPHYFPHIPFCLVEGARPGIPLKPDPRAMTDVERMLAHIPKSEICYVGDSNVDMETAANCDIAGVGAGWGFRGSRELRASGAWRVLESPLGLPPLVREAYSK